MNLLLFVIGLMLGVIAFVHRHVQRLHQSCLVRHSRQLSHTDGDADSMSQLARCGSARLLFRLTAVDLIKQRLPVELAMTIRNVRPLWDRLFGHDHERT